MSKTKTNVNIETETYTEDDKRVDELLEKYYDKHYDSLEEFQKDVYEHIDRALKQVEEGKAIPMEIAVAQLKAKYGI